MRQVERSALVPYTAAQMFALVDDIGTYPEFLPWCKSAVVHFREDNTVEATLELQRGGISKSFRTRNSNEPAERIAMSLVEGPFRHLQGTWSFTQLADAGSKVELSLAFAFSSSMLDRALGRFFEETCNALVEAFTDRAAEIYGSSR